VISFSRSTSDAIQATMIISRRPRWMFLASLCCMQLTGCVIKSSNAVEEDILRGSISYPFAAATESLGHDRRGDSFVIKSATNTAEYTIEIPGSASEYDITIPLAALEPGGNELRGAGGSRPTPVGNPATTDREIVSQMPRIDGRHPGDTALLDSAFGVGEKGGPQQSPSYTLGISRINNHYRDRKYEFALIEINNMLAFYPTAPQLHKMKGTVLIRMQNFALAEKSWLRAIDLTPGDVTLRRGLERLQRRLRPEGSSQLAPSSDMGTAAAGSRMDPTRDDRDPVEMVLEQAGRGTEANARTESGAQTAMPEFELPPSGSLPGSEEGTPAH